MPKCHSNKVGYLENLYDDNGEIMQFGYSLLERVDRDYREVHWASTVEAYVCTTCGYMETYVKEPASVPFERLEGFSWVGAKDDGPYR